MVTMSRLADLDNTYVAFWPHDGSSSYGPFQVTLVSEKPQAEFTELRLTLSKHKQSVKYEIKVLQLDNWPMGNPVPQSPNSIIRIIQELDSWQQQNGNKPILVTCCDGASRCGLFCVSSLICQQIRHEATVDVFQAVKTIRSSRPQVINNTDQYTFCYQLAMAFHHTGRPVKERTLGKVKATRNQTKACNKMGNDGW
ncbi:receptor-type tyrosine-protein phosphatase alpha-like [Hemiscyllium ocellatum]|uniref:receptor-type tyrosine-protein phosphatase alpha-like n=1 Tax=Hemiscyllium ocellatum TaxID=170820 RepID=UPI002965F3A8|nr:receptor-type tyrosine-protein phosphatase alpha-like [Hemiscyllium ocellatum]